MPASAARVETAANAAKREILEETFGFHGTIFAGQGKKLENPTEIEQLFYEHIRVYNSYWRDDPVFDCTNTLEAAPHLPCPTIDKAMLMRLAQEAVRMDFRFKDKPAVRRPETVGV